MKAINNASLFGTKFSWIKDVWTGHFFPKMKVFLQSIIQGTFSLGDNLQKRGIQTEILCTKCQDKETTMHTFFTCPFSIGVWKSILFHRVVHIATEDEFEKVSTLFKDKLCLPPTRISRNILMWICWSIWLASNSLIFEASSSISTDVATRALRLAGKWIRAQHSGYKISKILTDPTKNIIQATTLDIRTICKNDATQNKLFTEQAGLAWIFTGTGFTTLLQGSCTQDFVNSSLMAEALVMCLAIINAEQSTKSCRLKKFMESFVISMRSPLRSSISPSFIPLVIETEKPMR